jgi:hypothetical protein
MRMRLLAAVWLIGIVCSPGWAVEPRFRLTVLMEDWMELGRAQTWEEAWPRLKAASGAPFFTIDERDVAAYDWQAQRIVLRPEVNQRLLEAAQKLPRVPGRLGKLKALWSDDDLWDIFVYRGFVVSLDGEPLYGGLFLQKHSNLAMDYPVIHWAMDDDRRIILRLSPIQFTFGSLWDDGSGDALEDEVHPAVREIRQVFPTVKEDLEEESWKRIDSFKRRIQDPRIQKVFAALKTPAQAPPLRVERPAPAQPVRVSVNPYSRDVPSSPFKEGWSLFFGWPETVSEIRYRRAWQGERARWRVACDQGQASLGELPPGRYKIDIEALDWAGEVVGRYVFWLDPEREDAFRDKILMEETSNDWIDFHDSEKGDWSGLYFHALLNPWGALREIRYSLDGCALDRRFPVSFKDSDGKEKISESVPPETVFACVQLVYQDGEASPSRRFYHHDVEPEPEPAPSEPVAANPAPPAGPQPVSLKTQRYDESWELYLDLEDGSSTREIRYRFGNDPEWHPVRPSERIDLITGERYPSQRLWLTPEKVRLGRHRLEVKLKDWNGVESGPYVLWFDLEAEIVKKAKDELLAADSEWADFDDEYDLVSFSKLQSWRNALREVRYSFDGCALDRRYPFLVWTRLSEVSKGYEDFFVRGVKAFQSVCVQVVFRDGEVTEPRQYFRKTPPAP